MRLGVALALTLAGASVLALAAWRLLPGAAPPGPRVRAVLVDVSASATRPCPGYGSSARRVLEREARAALEAGEELLVVLVSAEVRRAFGPGAPEAFLDRLAGTGGAPFDPLGGVAPESALASDLAGGVRAVEVALLERGAGAASLLVVGDGSYTGRDPALELARLAARGVHRRGLEPVPPERWDAALAELRVPPRVEPGAPVGGTAVVVLRAGAAAGPVELTLGVEAAPDDSGARATVAVPVGGPGTYDVPFSLGPAPPGGARIAARVRLGRTPDPIPENDAASAFVAVGDERVLGVAAPAGSAALARALFDPPPAGLAPRFLGEEELVASLSELDAVVLLDPALDRLPAAPLGAFVRDGGGLLVAGGWELLSGWSPAPGPDELASLLPLAPDPGDDGPREVVVLVDGSGSMAGDPFEQVAAASGELVRAAPRTDRVTLRFFAGTLREPYLLREPGAPGDAAAAAARVFDAGIPGGGTRILSSLEALADERAHPAGSPDSPDARGRALVLLLTDGREPGDVIDVERRARELRARLGASRTGLVVFAVGERADRAFLREIAGEPPRDASDLTELGELFTREVNRERVREGAAIPVRRGEPGPEGSELVRQLVPSDAPEPAQRVLRTRPRAGAVVALATDEGEPVLAAGRAGRGRVAVLATLPSAGWAAGWNASDLAPALRWLGRRTEPAPRATVDDGRLLVRGLPADLPPIVPARLRPLDGRRDGGEAAPMLLELPVDPAGASPADARAGELPAGFAGRASGNWVVDLLGAGGEPRTSVAFRLHGAPELREPRRRLSAGAAGPVPSPAVGPPLTEPRDGVRAGPAGTWLVAVGLGLVLAAGLATRRGKAHQGSGRTGR